MHVAVNEAREHVSSLEVNGFCQWPGNKGSVAGCVGAETDGIDRAVGNVDASMADIAGSGVNDAGVGQE